MKLNILNKINRKFTKLISRYGIGKGKKMKSMEEARQKSLPMQNLHLGCGNIHINGWCNVDVIPTGATDLVLDIATLPGVKNSSVERIYSCHVLEHFSANEIPKILNRWFEVLTPGGEIRISVPDLDSITRIYQKNIAHFQKPGNQPWIALIYGGQKDPYDFHKTGFNFCYMKWLLDGYGFINISQYDHEPHFIPGVLDNSSANAQFGEYISLNVMAFKPT